MRRETKQEDTQSIRKPQKQAQTLKIAKILKTNFGGKEGIPGKFYFRGVWFIQYIS
jgi:hypothetical protein